MVNPIPAVAVVGSLVGDGEAFDSIDFNVASFDTVGGKILFIYLLLFEIDSKASSL